MYILKDISACAESGVLNLIFLAKLLVKMIKIGVPIMLIIVCIIDLARMITGKDDAYSKIFKKILERFMAAIAVFLVFDIVTFIVSAVGDIDIKTTNCFKKATAASINSIKKKEEDKRKNLANKAKEKEEKKKQEEQWIWANINVIPNTDKESSNSKSNSSKKDNNKKTTKKKSGDTSSTGYPIEYKDGAWYVGGLLIVNKTYPLAKSYNPGDLKDDFNTAFNKMQKAAEKDGITLKVVSGFRSYATQKDLYDNYKKSNSKGADTYSARPGHSEHQSGLAADINNADESFNETTEAKWLDKNCYKYGFIIRYPKGKEKVTGYIYESWHLRYVGTLLSEKLYNKGNWITLEEHLGITSQYD